jgi:hypothetical protein
MKLPFSGLKRSSPVRFGLLFGGLLALAAFLALNGPAAAQTPPPTTQAAPAPTQLPANPTAPPPTATGSTTGDYLSESLRLLFPAAPASLEWANLEAPIFPSDTPTFDLVSLGILKAATPPTKTLTLDLGGGVRGRLFAQPPWLSPLPDRFINGSGNGRLQVNLNVRQDAGQAAGLLPGQTNWGHLLLSLNGTLFDYAVPLIVEPPPAIKREDGPRVFALQHEIAERLDSQGDLAAFIGSPAYPNAGQVALGLAVDYLGENEYNQRLGRADFSGRVAEMLAQKDYNRDGWVGFRPEDILLGAPGWALGYQTGK